MAAAHVPDSTTPTTAMRPGLRRLALIMVLFGACGLIAADLIVPQLRRPETSSTPTLRTVISYDMPDGIATLSADGVARPAQAAGATGIAPYACQSVMSVGHVSIGRGCASRMMSVSATK